MTRRQTIDRNLVAKTLAETVDLNPIGYRVDAVGGIDAWVAVVPNEAMAKFARLASPSDFASSDTVLTVHATLPGRGVCIASDFAVSVVDCDDDGEAIAALIEEHGTRLPSYIAVVFQDAHSWHGMGFDDVFLRDDDSPTGWSDVPPGHITPISDRVAIVKIRELELDDLPPGLSPRETEIAKIRRLRSVDGDSLAKDRRIAASLKGAK